MYARAIEDFETRLVELRHDEVQQLALSSTAFVASLAATAFYPALVVPLFLGGVAVGMLGIRALWQRWDLVDRLADERDAYVIPEVRAYAARDARMERRLTHAVLIRSWLGGPGTWEMSRILGAADDLEALAQSLEDAALELDPASAVACRRLLTEPLVSPLLNDMLPPEDVGTWILQIRDGFTARRRL